MKEEELVQSIYCLNLNHYQMYVIYIYVVYTSLTDLFSIAFNISNLIFNRNNPTNPKKIIQLEHTELSLALNNYDWSIIINNNDDNSATDKLIDIF